MTKQCEICDCKPSKYCCPRCHIFYCSLVCYQSEKHVDCSENFYKQCVEEELASKHVDPESKAKMIEILKRHAEENCSENLEEQSNNSDDELDSDDQEEVELEERIKHINLEDADDLWEVLTEDEKNKFRALVSSNEIDEIVPFWEPWWTSHVEENLVKDIEETDRLLEEMLNKCPSILEVPPLESLSSKKPSEDIIYNIVNVLAAYAFVMRYLNGEAEPTECASYILAISANLETNTNFCDWLTAVKSVEVKCMQSPLIETDEIGLGTMKKDTLLIQKGPNIEKGNHYCQAALSHVHKIFEEAKNCKTKNPKKNGAFSRNFCENIHKQLPKLDRLLLKRSLKKIEYYLACVHRFSCMAENLT